MDDDEVNALEEVLEEFRAAAENAAIPRQVHQEVNPFEVLDDVRFVQYFRLTKVVAQTVIDMLRPHLVDAQRSTALDIQTKVLVALLFYAHGSYQKMTGKNIFASVSQASVSRCIKEVTEAFNSEEIRSIWIKFPTTVPEFQDLRTRFYAKYRLPGVVGCIDCTHIAIVRPKDNEHVYLNRKRYTSLNVQLVCDENLRILNVVNRFPGSAHDAYIWRQSQVAVIMEQMYRHDPQNHYFLLGDMGYPLRPWLLTPLRNVEPNTPEERYNRRLTSIRSIIERCNGVLKNRWRCLLKDRVLHYAPEASAHIVMACCVLHNICVSHNLAEPAEILEEEHEVAVHANIDVGNVNNDLIRARELQHEIAQRFF